jgi:hypothetical protein
MVINLLIYLIAGFCDKYYQKDTIIRFERKKIFCRYVVFHVEKASRRILAQGGDFVFGGCQWRIGFGKRLQNYFDTRLFS